ncbi:hypothetical protein B0H13DRAFT_2320461 [Mycena leptocephala]|nr:hypothetical protein B0H13DRAFT_2320461 [Mycena leptocephala]
MSFQTETFSISQPGPSGVPATNTTIIYQYTDWFRGCIMVPDDVMTTCCGKVGSSVEHINGTFGCLYSSAFPPDTGKSNETWHDCCTSNPKCLESLCLPNFLDSPYPGDNASSATTTATSTASSPSTSPNHARRLRNPSILMTILMVSLLLVH